MVDEKCSGKGEGRGGRDGCSVGLIVDLALGKRAQGSTEDQAARLVSPKRWQVRGLAATSWAPGCWQHQGTGCSLPPCGGVFLSQGPCRGCAVSLFLGLIQGAVPCQTRVPLKKAVTFEALFCFNHGFIITSLRVDSCY